MDRLTKHLAKSKFELGRRIIELEDLLSTPRNSEANELLSLINYDYRKAVYDDVVKAVPRTSKGFPCFHADKAALVDYLTEALAKNPAVTGYGRSGYWHSDWKAALALSQNYDLLVKASADFKATAYSDNDYLVRTSLLRECVEEAVDYLYEDETSVYDTEYALETYNKYVKNYDDMDKSEFLSRYGGWYECAEDAQNKFGLSMPSILGMFEQAFTDKGFYLIRK